MLFVKKAAFGGRWMLLVWLTVAGLLLAGDNFTALVAQTPPICDPGLPGPGLYLQDGGRYYATGGTDSNHDFKGADRWIDIRTMDPGFIPKWKGWTKIEVPFETVLFHDGDWVIYHFVTRGVTLEGIELCLQATVSNGSVEVFVQPGSTSVPPHDRDIRGQVGWTKVGVVVVNTVAHNIYKLSVTRIPPHSEYNIAVRLIEQAGDTNVLIAWIKLIA